MNELTKDSTKMKTNMKKTMMIMVLGALIACLVPAQAQDTQFQSTSTMKASGSAYTPQVQQVGAASAPVMATTTTETYSPTKGRGNIRKGNFDDSPEGGEGSGDSPIGDALLPLMLMALVFCGVIALRRKRNAMTNG